MRKDNPAMSECPRGSGGIHAWRWWPDGTAKCDCCWRPLSHEDADDAFGEFGAWAAFVKVRELLGV
jgi:hypothetical protein